MEIVYLANCDAGLSEICWYNDAAKSQNGEAPNATFQVSPNGLDVVWESGSVTAKFASYNFITYVNTNGGTQPAGTEVGTAIYGPIFDAPPPGSPPFSGAYYGYKIYRDNNRVLYNNATLGNAISIYNCVPTGQVVAGPPP